MDTSAIAQVDFAQWEQDYSSKPVVDNVYVADYQAWAEEPHDQEQEHYDAVWGYEDPLAVEAREFHRQESEMEDAIYMQESDAHDKAIAYSTLNILGDEPVESEWFEVHLYEEFEDYHLPVEDGVNTVEDIPF